MTPEELKDYVTKFLGGVRRFFEQNYPEKTIKKIWMTKFYVHVEYESGVNYGFQIFDQNICDYFALRNPSLEDLIKIVEDELNRQNP